MQNHFAAEQTSPAVFPELRPFLNERGQLIRFPAKRRKKLLALYYLGEKLEADRTYTEAQINALLDDWTAFHDPATLRREMYNAGLLNRTPDGRSYWKAEELPVLEVFLRDRL